MQPASPKPGLFRATPPAIFPPILGLLGIGLAWRRASGAFSAPEAIGEVILGAVTLLYLFALVAYIAKIMRRPGVVGEDLATLPGRAGLATMGMAGMLLAGVLTPLWTGLAQAVLVLALAGHAVVALMILRLFITGPAEARKVTPVWHLSFVGFIVGAMTALPLGWNGLANAIFWVTLVLALAIWGVSLRQIVARQTPAPLRPTLAIHLAPASLLGMVAFLLGQVGLGQAFGLLAIAILALLLVKGRWLTESGFSPFWGAFTFPLAAFSNLMMIMGEAGYGEVFRLLGGAALVIGTLFIAWIATRVMKLWANGKLAAGSNAARA